MHLPVTMQMEQGEEQTKSLLITTLATQQSSDLHETTINLAQLDQ